MFTSTLSLLSFAVVGLAAASDYPELSTSKAYRLYVNVTDLSQDFNPPVHGLEIGRVRSGLTTVHFRAVTVPPNRGSVFFQNPHPEFFNESNAPFWTNTLTMGEHHVQGLQLISKNAVPGDDDSWYGPHFNVTMNVGEGEYGQTLNPEGPIAYAYPSVSGISMEYLVCNTTFGEREKGNYALDALHWTNRGPDYSLHPPADCLRVKLLPQCDTVDKIVAGEGDQEGKEELALYLAKAENVRCYHDVRGIDWKKYKNY